MLRQCLLITILGFLASLAIGTVPKPGYAQSDAAWKPHDMNRPLPSIITPAPQDQPVPPPSDAIMLFDGDDLDAWTSGGGGDPQWDLKDGYFQTVPGRGSIRTRQPFGDVQLHVEWASSPQAEGIGQKRGNSGVYLMGQYEVQVLDSYESITYADGQAAAIYGQYPPLVNASRPPGEWQTYDIIFRRPRFASDGTLKTPVRLTMLHNGVLVQDNVKLKGPSNWLRHSPYRLHPDKLPLVLQNHENPVRFRNIWVRELRESTEPGPTEDTTPPTIVMTDGELDAYVGDYRAYDGSTYRIRKIGSQLQAQFYNSMKHELVPHSPKEFSLQRTSGRILFDLDDSGHPIGLTFDLGGRGRPAERITESETAQKSNSE